MTLTTNEPPTTMTPPTSRGTRTQQDIEATFDKFSTLFHPSTPRTSPNANTASLPNEPLTARPRPAQNKKRRSVSQSSDEFGSFVSVPPAEDPLSAGAPSFEEEFLHTPTAPAAASGSKSRSRPSSIVEGDNPSLSFFDRVGQDAIRASEARGRDLVGELMRHEEDPRVWLAEHNEESSHGTRGSNTEEAKPTQLAQEPLIPLPPETGDKPDLPHSQFSLDDIDASYFTPPRSPPTRPIPTQNTSSPRLINVTPQSTLAPPIASTSTHITASPPTLSSSPPFERRTSSEARAEGERPASPRRSSSYQTLSSISAKWIPSLFTVKSEERQRPSLDSVFNTQQQQPRHTLSLPIQGTAPEEVTHSSSPFASHGFSPISGAPGFKPEGYDWDKGYSGDLERDLLVSGIQRKLDPQPVDRGRERGRAGREEAERRVEEQRKMNDVIERRSGGVELIGRKESTVGVLSSGLASSIRSHLPALARLPRTWTLLYSLDQHGISLNTLYTRCETHLSNPKVLSKGALVVVRDSGDTVFGAWIGEGIRMCRGKGYYGGGESFLWSQSKGKEGKVRVWKWTGRNDYVALCEAEFISFGGGDGHYGLYLDSSLYDGSSAPCPTFANEPLCTSGPLKAGTMEFECVGLEVWGLGT